MNHVYLNSTYNEFYVNETTYEQIVALVQANKHCTFDYHEIHPYTEDNPCVGRSICLTHWLKKHPNLVYAGEFRVEKDNSHTYTFLDKQGYVYTATEDSTQEMQRDVLATLAYYGFTPPDKVESRGKLVDFYSYYASLYGDLHSASVIVLSYQQQSEKVKGLFLLYKNGPAKMLLKRSDLYSKAVELVEASKDEHGEYHINGHSHYRFYEADVYDVVSQLESAMYDVTRRLQNGKQGPDNRTGEDA